jgi:hypothetical protein
MQILIKINDTKYTYQGLSRYRVGAICLALAHKKCLEVLFMGPPFDDLQIKIIHKM